MNTDRIEKQIHLNAPVARVWRALTDHREFNKWFRVKLESPFEVGQPSSGQITYPGYEHLRMTIAVTAIEPESYFAYTWHPGATGPDVDTSKETPTLVEFRLEKSGEGTLLTVTESGFDKIPPERRDDAFRSNDSGWTEQVKNIKAHVER